MSAVVPLLLGFVTAFVGSVPIAGPLAVVVLRRATRGDRRGGFFVALGGALAEALVALAVGLIFPALGELLDNVVVLARGLGVVVLLVVGVALLVRPNAGEHITAPRPRRRVSLLIGLVVTGMNPTIIATWLLVVTTLYATGWLEPSFVVAPAFAVGVLFGVVAWFSIVLVVGQRLESVITDQRRSLLMRGLGGLMICGALYVAVKLVTEL